VEVDGPSIDEKKSAKLLYGYMMEESTISVDT